MQVRGSRWRAGALNGAAAELWTDRAGSRSVGLRYWVCVLKPFWSYSHVQSSLILSGPALRGIRDLAHSGWVGKLIPALRTTESRKNLPKVKVGGLVFDPGRALLSWSRPRSNLPPLAKGETSGKGSGSTHSAPGPRGALRRSELVATA